MPLTHKGYTAEIRPEECSPGHVFGRVAGIRDVVTFRGIDGPSAAQAFRDSVDDYLALCVERGEGPNPPPPAPCDAGRPVPIVGTCDGCKAEGVPLVVRAWDHSDDIENPKSIRLCELCADCLGALRVMAGRDKS